MSEPQREESGEESVDGTGRNPTQRHIDEEVSPEAGGAPVDVGWDGVGRDGDAPERARAPT